MTRARDITKTWQGQLYFVYLPEWQRFENPNLANPERERILQIVEDLDIPIIDIYSAFATQDDPLALFPFRLHGHYNEEGYKLVATEILRFIENEPHLSASQSLP